MNQPTTAPRTRSRRRGSVEVYFLLYLSAIILLLGTTQGHHDREDLQDTVLDLLAPGFRVEAEKPALLWRFVPAGISRDSTLPAVEQDSTNIITAYGTVEDLRFAIVEIEDTLSGSSLPSEAATLTRIGERSAVFRWQPERGRELENRVYRVTVRASGRPIPPRDINPESRRKIRAILERGGTVSDSVTFTVNLLSTESRGGMIVQTPTLEQPRRDSQRVRIDTVRLAPPPTPAILPAFDIQVATTDVEATPGSAWNNRVTVSEPAGGDVTWSYLPGTLQLDQASQKGITLRGTLPASGSEQRVTVTARRSTDGATATTSFRVVPRSETEEMKIPMTMYVGQVYNLELGRSRPGERSEVRVLLGNTVLGPYSQPVIQFKPATTGQVRFIRTINGQETERTANVAPLPAPEVRILERGDDYVVYETTGSGRVKDVENRVKLNIVDGNASDPEELVDRRRSRETQAATEHYQYWRITPKESGAFVFRVQATDRRGSATGKSPVVSYP